LSHLLRREKVEMPLIVARDMRRKERTIYDQAD